MKLILRYCRELIHTYPLLFAKAIAMILLITALNTAIPCGMRYYIDAVTANGSILMIIAGLLLFAACMLLGGKMILGCFISGTPEEFEQTMQIAYFYLAVMSLCLPILYILHVTRSVIQGMGNTVLPMASGIAEFFMRALTAVFLPLLIGETGIFYAEIMAWTGAVVILVISYFVVMKKAAG